MASRKRFKTVDQPTGAETTWTSEVKAYEHVNTARKAYEGGSRAITAVTVYEHDSTSTWSGRDPWALFESLDFTRGQ